jgi:hypothetical protein
MMFMSDLARRALAPVFAGVHRFRRDDNASLSVEAVLITPLLLWGFLATYTYFDVYRVKNIALKSNYAVSDLLSRETSAIDMNYIDGARNLYRYLTGANGDAWLRISVLRCTEDCAVSPSATSSGRTLVVDWSRGTGDAQALSDEDVMTNYDDIIPVLAFGDQLIMVETSMDYEPIFSSDLTGIGEQTFTDIVLTRPRFASQFCFEGTLCGGTGS